MIQKLIIMYKVSKDKIYLIKHLKALEMKREIYKKKNKINHKFNKHNLNNHKFNKHSHKLYSHY